ncbi:pyroglutamyl-peptidase I [Oenococcus alcoholitolerans]|uniref:Pyrrolidone-carboxylate peptidase n=1 Tax=Oenococcus alcoholitolerans TaxID=931074 RepID=A0ABR4XSH1_9LACO|nr:pyrrolidone-carboxylate peptidase [Oenococcus alcoholitolerans]
MKLLLTGFDPFGKDDINPSFEAVKKMPDKIEGIDILKLEIPTIFNKCAEIIHQQIVETKPDIILCIGQAGGRYAITPERVAINLDDARIADNAGQKPVDRKIKNDGQTAYFSQLPIKKMSKAIISSGLHSCVSNSAGTFVCNHIMYQVQYMIDKEFNNIKAGFIHIPFLPSQIINRPNMPCLSLEDDVRGLTAAIKAITQ